MHTWLQRVSRYGKWKLLALILCINTCGLSSRTVFSQEEVEAVVSGVVVGRDGQPAAGATVAICRHSEDIAHGKSSITDANGNFSVAIVAAPRLIEAMHLESKSANGNEIGYLALRSAEVKLDLRTIQLRLNEVKKARMLVIDGDDQPVAGATAVARLGDAFGRVISATTDKAGMADLNYTDAEPIAIAFAMKDNVGFDYHFYQPAQQGFGEKFSTDKPERFKLSGAKAVKLKIVDDQQRPLKGIKIYPLVLSKSTRVDLQSNDLNLSFFLKFIQRQTDAKGEVSFDWIPEWQTGRLSFMTSGGSKLVHSPSYVDLDNKDDTKQGTHEIQLDHTVAIRGQVIDVDGKPAKGITVSAQGHLGSGTKFIAHTNDVGNYEVLVPPNQMYMVVIKDQNWASTPQQGFAVLPNTPVEGKDFKLRKATRIFGKVRSGFWLADVSSHQVVITQVGKSLRDFPDIQLPEPKAPRRLNLNARPTETFETWTDEHGEFELFVGDGVFFRTSDGQDSEFTINGEESFQLDFTVTSKAAPRVLTDTTAPLLGLIVDDATNQPIRDCSVIIVPRAPTPPDSDEARPSWQATTDADGKFRAERIRIGSFIHAISSDKKLAAIMEIKRDKNVFVMKLRPVGSATGRLLAADGSKPIANQKLGCLYLVPDQKKDAGGRESHGTPSFVVDRTTDADGRFTFEHLAPNVEYSMYEGPELKLGKTLLKLTVEPGEKADLGEVKLP